MGLVNLSAKQMTRRELALALDVELCDLVSLWRRNLLPREFEGLAKLAAETHRRAARVVVGYRVRSSDGCCVVRDEEKHNVYTTVMKVEPIARYEAYRLAAYWIEAGYLPTIHRVKRRPS